MMTDQDGIAGSAVQPQSGAPATQVPETAQITPSDRKIGVSRSIDGMATTPILKILTVTLDPDLGQPSRVEVNGEAFEPVKPTGPRSLDELIEIADRVGSSVLSERAEMLSSKLADIGVRASLDAMAAETMGSADGLAAFDRLTLPTDDDRRRFSQMEDLLASQLVVARRAYAQLYDVLVRVNDEGPQVAALAVKLADAEEQLAKYEAVGTDSLSGVDEVAKALRGSAMAREQRSTAANLLERMRAAIRHDREHAGKIEARVRVLTAQLADMTTNRDALDEACQRKDKRIVATEIERDTARDIAALFRERLTEIRDYLAKEERFAPTIKIIDATLETVPPERPRCRVVTSPRFYGDVEHRRAVNAAARNGIKTNMDWGRWENVEEIVDVVATALGMRRAAK
jgi:hypothetical protein